MQTNARPGGPSTIITPIPVLYGRKTDIDIHFMHSLFFFSSDIERERRAYSSTLYRMTRDAPWRRRGEQPRGKCSDRGRQPSLRSRKSGGVACFRALGKVAVPSNPIQKVTEGKETNDFPETGGEKRCQGGKKSKSEISLEISPCGWIICLSHIQHAAAGAVYSSSS